LDVLFLRAGACCPASALLGKPQPRDSHHRPNYRSAAKPSSHWKKPASMIARVHWRGREAG
jgi:hypothetical protein